MNPQASRRATARSLCLLVLVVAAFLAPTGRAEEPNARPAQSLWYEAKPEGEIVIPLYFFWSAACPHCAEARPFVEALPERYPWLRIESLETTRSSANRQLFADLAQVVGQEIRGVPSFFFCGAMLVGYDDDAGRGRELASLLERCHAYLVAELEPPATAPETAPTTAELPFVGRVDLAAWSLPLTTVVIGALDAFNPCAFFVLLFLLSLMVHGRSRARMALIGGVFVFFSGALYFLFMAAWLNLFLVLEGLAVITTVAGAVAVALSLVNIKDFFLFGRGVTLSIPERAKPGLFARMRGLVSADSLPTMLFGTATLAVVANTYELICTSGFPLVYTRLLTLNELPGALYYLYLLLYNLVYVLPLLAIVVVFTLTLGARKLGEREGRVLKLLSGIMMLGLGAVLILEPELLDSVVTAGALLLGALGLTAVVVWGEANWRRRSGRVSP